MAMRIGLVVLTAVVALCWGKPGLGQEPEASLALPQMAACTGAKHPVLPEKWRATYLAAPFSTAQLILADIEHDGTLGATRARLYGLKHGAADFLILGRRTYLLDADDAGTTQCRDLGD